MDRFKALTLVLLGVVMGLGYAVACGSGDGASDAARPLLPGIGVAMAQSACGQYEVRTFSVQQGEEAQAGFRIEPGWTPLSSWSGLGIWAARCAQ